MIYKRSPDHRIEYVSPFPPKGGWYDYETAATKRPVVPFNGDPNNLGILGFTFGPWTGKPRIRVRAGREVVE